jgi:hypothetical protein
MGTQNYLGGGKLGDFIHSLVVCKFVYETLGYKANLYISDKGDGFNQPLNIMHKELTLILENQEWLNIFSIYNNEDIDIDLTKIRNSPYIFRTNWIEIYLHTYLENINIPKDYKWIELDKEDKYKNSLIINRTIKNMSEYIQNKYNEIIKMYDDVYFICFDIEQYNSFPLKDKVKLLKVENLYEYYSIINSCKHFLGNQSSPTAMATSLDKSRTIELFNDINAIHYMNDIKYYTNFNYFISDTKYG